MKSAYQHVVPKIPSAAGMHMKLAFTGLTRQSTDGWGECRARSWVIDYLNRGQQPQRVGRRARFMRRAEVAALYAPGTVYHEFRQTSYVLDESYILFEASGGIAERLGALTGRDGYCHFRDNGRHVGNALRHIGELTGYRPPGHDVLVCSLFLQVVAAILMARPVRPYLRAIESGGPAHGHDTLAGKVEHFVRERITEPLSVADLARHVGLGVSAFAHRYPKEAGESPYQTILRLKLAKGKDLMQEESLSVKETAYRLGFSNEFNFSRTFKKQEGMSPKAFREAVARRG